jgi:hypothetical protein
MWDDAAYSRVENGNDLQNIESGGIHIEGESFPVPPNSSTGFYLQPIQGDSNPGPSWTGEPESELTWSDDLAPAVLMSIEHAANGSIIFAFDGWNHVDGICNPQP